MAESADTRIRRLLDTEADPVASLLDLLVAERRAERAVCRGAVAGACAPITGTPYIAGPRAFTAAIDALASPASGHAASPSCGRRTMRDQELKGGAGHEQG